MYREILLLLFALSAVPLALFFWDIFKGMLSQQWSSVVNGFVSSWQGLVPAVILVVITLFLLHKHDKKDGNAEDRRFRDLGDRIISAINDLGDKLMQNRQSKDEQDDETKQ